MAKVGDTILTEFASVIVVSRPNVIMKYLIPGIENEIKGRKINTSDVDEGRDTKQNKMPFPIQKCIF